MTRFKIAGVHFDGDTLHDEVECEHHAAAVFRAQHYTLNSCERTPLDADDRTCNEVGMGLTRSRAKPGA
jgi:hypothetical protein